MIRPLALLMLLVASPACKASGNLATIEEAEAYAKSRGVVLTEKKENTDQMVASRAYAFKANGPVECDVLQFASEKAAGTWKKAMDELPVGGGTRIQKGPIVFAIWGATDAERQKVIEALK